MITAIGATSVIASLPLRLAFTGRVATAHMENFAGSDLDFGSVLIIGTHFITGQCIVRHPTIRTG